MQNCNSSVGTTAQKSSKSRLLFRPATLAAILMLAAGLFSSCENPVEENKKYFEDKSKSKRITGVEYLIYKGAGFYILKVDSVEYVASSYGGIYPLLKNTVSK
jgi:hypothetical protein